MIIEMDPWNSNNDHNISFQAYIFTTFDLKLPNIAFEELKKAEILAGERKKDS